MQNNISTGDTLLNVNKKSGFPILINCSIILLASVIVFFYFFAFIRVDGTSMENTFYNQQYVIVQRKSFSVNRGDVVIIEKPDIPQDQLIKRVIALDNDKLLFMESRDQLYIDIYMCKSGEKKFTLLNEPYLKETMKKNTSANDKLKIMRYNSNVQNLDTSDRSLSDFIIEIPSGSFYFLGDNRNVSSDSRKYGAIKKSYIKAKVLKVVY